MISSAPLSEVDPEISALLDEELKRKEFSLELIPSENCVSEAVLEVTGSVFTDKYCEGYPGRRYYGGCRYYDDVERIARDRAKELFGAERANVQPHSGANANMAVFYGLIKPGDTVLGLKLDHGGHLTHGSPVNFSGRDYNVVAYGVQEESGLLDEDQIMSLAKEHKPKLIVCGATAYSRQIDFEMFRKAADEAGALLLADVSHYSGMIVAGEYPNPVPYADVVTTTTHKTLRGPRGGLIMCKPELYKQINKAVFPGLQGGPLMHQIAAKAVAFGEALKPEFKVYAKQIISNARALAQGLIEGGFNVLTGGTDSHVMVVDFRGTDYTGAQAEETLEAVGITCNKNTVPFDPQPASVTSGIRIGTPAITSRGMTEADMVAIAGFITQAIENAGDEAKLKSIREDVRELCSKYPLYPQKLSKLQ